MDQKELIELQAKYKLTEEEYKHIIMLLICFLQLESNQKKNLN